MRTLLTILGIVLAIAGASMLFMQQISFTSQENKLVLGTFKVIAVEKDILHFNRGISIATLVGGVAIIAAANLRRHKKLAKKY